MPKTTRGTGGGKRHPLSMRTTKETRERLEAAAIANGRSLAQEVEARLEGSFVTEAGFGSAELTRMAYLMAAAFAMAAQRNTAGNSAWLGDPVAYSNCVAAVFDALFVTFPSGDNKALALENLVGRLESRLRREKEENK